MNSVETEGGRIEIPLSKLKIGLLLVGALIFVAGGVLFIINPSTFTDSGLHHSPKFEILAVGYACVIFFGAGVVIFILQLFNKNPGLLINNEGITINPGSSSNSFIEWNNIEKFGIKNVSQTKLIMVYLKNPEDLINNLSSPIKRKMALFSLKNYGTPISISTGGLKCSTDELYNLLTDKLNKINH